MKRFVLWVVLLGLVAGAVLLYLSWPAPVRQADMPAHSPNVENGKLMFTAGGCLSCHKPDEKNTAADKSLPSGGAPLKTPVGTFYPPNLTPDDVTGIGRWQVWEFVSAMKRGISPDGQHYIPAFPYTSYAAMRTEDIIDIHAYLKSLKPVQSASRAADVPLLWFARLGTGVWKLLALQDKTFQADPQQSDEWNRGAYLVKAPGHCGECHTPRNIAMIPDESRHLAGGPHPEDPKAKVPSLRSLVERKRFKDAADLVNAFQWGEAFGYEDLSSGGMGDVQEKLAELSADELKAIATYLVSLK